MFASCSFWRKLTKSLSTIASDSIDISSESGLASVIAEVGKLKTRLSETEKKIDGVVTIVNGINDGISKHFTSLSESMASILITALLAVVSLIVAVLLASINIFFNRFIDGVRNIQAEAKSL
jgi:hypothetical protein